MKPVDGLNVFAMSLGDVLYDPKTQRYYVTNTGKQVDMQSINPASETEATDDAEGGSEERYNHNHGSDGRFTTGSGSPGVDNGRKGGKIGAGKKTKYAPSPREHQEGITISPKEFGMLRGICTTDHREMMENGGTFTAALGNYLYKIKSYGEYSFCVLQKIKYMRGRRK